MKTITRPAHRPTKNPGSATLRSLYATMTQPEIAAQYRVSIRTVARWLKTAGVSKDVK